MDKKQQAYEKLTQIAAALARGDGLPSPRLEYHRQKTYSARKVAKAAGDHRAWQEEISHEIRMAALEMSGEIRLLSSERDALAVSIRNAAVKAGICRDDAALTGPHLLMLCADMATALAPSGKRVVDNAPM